MRVVQSVQLHVLPPLVSGSEGLVTHVTLVWFFPGVHADVISELLHALKSLPTVTTLMRSFPRVYKMMAV